MKQLRQNTLYNGVPPQVSTQQTQPEQTGTRVLRSTAAILSQGVSLSQVQLVVKQLKPPIEEVS